MGVIDFDFLNEVAEGDPSYICDVIDIFLATVPPGIDNLKILISEGEDWEAIYKLSHSLKSSLGIIRIGNMHELMTAIEANAMSEKNKEKVQADLNTVITIFEEAYPELIAEKEKYELQKAQN